MESKQIYEDLQKMIPKLEIKQNETMTKHTSFKVGGSADIWIRVKTIEQLKEILHYAKEKNIPLTILGNGSNVLVKDKGIRGITLQLDFQKIEIQEENNKVEVLVEAGVKLGMLATILQKQGISGFEFACRHSWNDRGSHSYECRSLWKRNERCSYIYKMYGFRWKYI